MTVERLEILDVVGNPTRGIDHDDSGAVKIGLLVAIAGQPDPVLLLMTEHMTQVLAHVLDHGHRPD